MKQRSIVITDMQRITPENMLKIKLSHWNVEAQHWLLNVQLNEDKMTKESKCRCKRSDIAQILCVNEKIFSQNTNLNHLADFLWPTNTIFVGLRKVC